MTRLILAAALALSACANVPRPDCPPKPDCTDLRCTCDGRDAAKAPPERPTEPPHEEPEHPHEPPNEGY